MTALALDVAAGGTRVGDTTLEVSGCCVVVVGGVGGGGEVATGDCRIGEAALLPEAGITRVPLLPLGPLLLLHCGWD